MERSKIPEREIEFALITAQLDVDDRMELYGVMLAKKTLEVSQTSRVLPRVWLAVSGAPPRIIE